MCFFGILEIDQSVFGSPFHFGMALIRENQMCVFISSLEKYRLNGKWWPTFLEPTSIN